MAIPQNFALQALRLKGLLCPCLENREDAPAREAYATLSSEQPWKIQYYNDAPSSEKKGGSGGGSGRSMIGSLFSAIGSSVVVAAGLEETTLAKISIVDTFSGPSIKIVMAYKGMNDYELDKDNEEEDENTDKQRHL